MVYLFKALSPKIFTARFRILSQLLGNALVVWPPNESVRENVPKTLCKVSLFKLLGDIRLYRSVY